MGTGTNHEAAVPDRIVITQYGGLFREKKGWTDTIHGSLPNGQEPAYQSKISSTNSNASSTRSKASSLNFRKNPLRFLRFFTGFAGFA